MSAMGLWRRVVCVAAACALVVRAEAEPALAGLERVAAKMTEAVTAGDAAAYIEHVARHDAVFAVEQRNWAADLAAHRPEEFSIGFDASGLVEQRDGSVTVPMTMRWRMSRGRVRDLTYTARFVREDAAWRYAGEHWTRIETEAALVLVDPGLGATGVHIAALMPQVREVVDGLLETKPLSKPVVKLYSTMEHLQQSIYLSYVEPLGGWNEPGEAMKLLHSQRQSGRALRTLLAHEYGHVVTFAMGEEATHMPWWVLEGIAEWCAAAIDGSERVMERRVARWAGRDNLRSWDQLADFRGEAMNHMEHVYFQGHHMVRHIEREFGRAGLLAWLRAMAAGASLDEATHAVMGIGFDELDAAWRATIVGDPGG